jgi:hypothetical protein
VSWIPLLALLCINTDGTVYFQTSWEYALQIFRPTTTTKEHNGILFVGGKNRCSTRDNGSNCIPPQALGWYSQATDCIHTDTQKLRADNIRGMTATIQFRTSYLPVYLQTQKLKYAKLKLCLLFHIDVKLCLTLRYSFICYHSWIHSGT